MIDILSELNGWISDNRALSVSVGIPLLTVLIGFLGSYLTMRVKSAEVKMTGRLKLAEYRKDNFDELKSAVEDLLLKTREFSLGRLSDEPQDVKFTLGQFHELAKLVQSILVRTHHSRKLTEDLSNSFEESLDYIHSGRTLSNGDLPFTRLRTICSKILTSEWKAIEGDLKKLNK